MTLPPTATMDTARLLSLRDDKPDIRILDVRSGAEFETMHIPGSYNVPLETLGEHVADLADVSHPVVLVCQTGGRATQAHQKLVAAGKDTLHILEGGIAAWDAAGGEVARGPNDRWAMDRQVRLVAGTLALSGVLLSVVLPKAKWLSAGVGAGLGYSALSNTCAMAALLAKAPYNKSEKCDIVGVLADINKKAA